MPPEEGRYYQRLLFYWQMFQKSIKMLTDLNWNTAILGTLQIVRQLSIMSQIRLKSKIYKNDKIIRMLCWTPVTIFAHSWITQCCQMSCNSGLVGQLVTEVGRQLTLTLAVQISDRRNSSYDDGSNSKSSKLDILETISKNTSSGTVCPN